MPPKRFTSELAGRVAPSRGAAATVGDHASLLLRAPRITALAAIALVSLLLARPETAFGGWQTFTRDNGLADDHVGSMLEDRAGNLWFATDWGLSRYDGRAWRTFTTTEGVDCSVQSPLVEDRAGNVWVGAGHDVERYDGTSWRKFTIVPFGTAATVSCIVADRSRNVWFGTWGGWGVTRYDGTSWRTFTTADGLADNSVISILEDRAGNLWFRSIAGGLSRYDGTSWHTFTIATVAAGDPSIMLEDRSGNLWFVSTGGVTRYDGSTWRTFTTADGLASNATRSVLEDRAGNIWVRTWYGVSRYDGSSWRTFTTADGLDSNYVISMAEDRAGNLWFGTHGGGGVSRYDGTGWRTFNSADSSPLGHADQMLKDRVGNLWFASFVGVSRYDGSNWRTFDTADGLPDGTVTTMLWDHAGNLWVGTYAGVSRYDGSSWRTFTTADGLANNEVQSIVEDSAGNLWVGSTPGVSRYDGSSWQSFTTGNGLPLGSVFFVDRAGNLWVGTHDGLCRYDGRTCRMFTTADGLADNYVAWIFEDRAGNLWVATSSGVSRYDGSSWRTLTSADGLADNGVQSMLEDRAGNLWFLCGTGVSRYDGSSWHTFGADDGFAGGTFMLEDRAGNLWFTSSGGVIRYDGSSWRTFTTADGLVNNAFPPVFEDHTGNLWFAAIDNRVHRCNGGSDWRNFVIADGLVPNPVRSIVEDRKGNMWFGTAGGGVSRYEVDHIPPRAVFLTRPQRLSPSRNQSAAFIAAFRETRVEFSYRLDGGPWSVWSRVGSWVGSELQDGTHTLEVRPRDYSTNVDSGGAVVAFEIDATPPAPVIAVPTFGRPVRERVEIRGTATDARFQGYRVEFRPAGAASWHSPDATILTTSAAPVTNGLLATWDTSTLADGDYELQLSVTDTLQLTGSALVTVSVDNQAPFAEVTAPAKVSAERGGDLYTTHSELHLYFPPHAFDEDALVNIAGAAAPDAPFSGVTRVQPGYAIAWGSTALHKGATLEFSTAGRAGAVGAQAIYFSSDGSNWRRLGGTSEPGKVSLVVHEAGRYALYAETAVAEGGATLSELSFTPRAFSPRGSFANPEVGIGFTLGRGSSVTVRVYNRAGRLMREVVAGATMPPGANLVRWDGRDRGGSVVGDGLYVVTVEAQGQTRRNTLAVVR